MKIYIYLLYLLLSSTAFAGEVEETPLVQVASLLIFLFAFKIIRQKTKQ